MIKSGMKCFNPLLIFAFSFLSIGTLFSEGYLGINWGRLATQRMIPSMVVDVIMQNKFKEAKIFSASDNVMEAFGGTGIGLIITMTNGELIFMDEKKNLDIWITQNIIKFKDSINFRYVCIGTQPLSKVFFNSKNYPESVGVIDNAQTALNEVNMSHVKAIMDFHTDVLIPVQKPSEGEFQPDVKFNISKSCRILQKNQAPIGLNIFPLLSVNNLFNNDTEFGFFENNSTSAFKDGDKFYSNAFEVMYDMFDVALEKLGCPNMTIIVDAAGWPTDGIKDGNLKNAQRFYQGLAKFAASNKGTPRRPGPIDIYLHNLADENAVSRKAGPYMRHWGIYKFDGQPKFSLDLQGLGRENQLVSAIGITHMPKRWCIYNNKNAGRDVLEKLYAKACSISDCTALEPGGSCSNLTFEKRISYGFNMGFQAKYQKVSKDSCGFEGYGTIVSDDPSTPTCTFPVEILAAEVPNYTGIVKSN